MIKLSSYHNKLALATTLLIVSLANPSLAQEKKMPRVLSVTGRGIVTIPTTVTIVNLAIEVQGKDPKNVQQEAAKRSSRVVDFLKSRNVQKLQTNGISLTPNYSYQNNQQKIIGYTATNSLSFRVNTDLAGNIIDESIKAGATRIDGVSNTASDESITIAQTQALKEATKDAQRQSDAVLSTLNLSTKEILSIQINGAYTPPPIPLPRAMDAKLESSPTPSTPVVSGEQQVEANITLQVSY